MRVAVISDTHDVLREEVVEQIRLADAVIHAGDVSKPQIIDRIKAEMPDNAKLYLVRGNADGEWAKDIPETLKLELEGLRIFVVHNRKKAAIPEHIDIVIFGHTHKYLMETETISVSGNQAMLHSKNEKGQDLKCGNGTRLWLNPGACGRQRFRSELTMAVLLLDDGKWQVEKIVMEPKGKILQTVIDEILFLEEYADA